MTPITRSTGWRLALRIARREALRHRGRSLLTLVLIALPVLGVTAADVLAKTQSVSPVESLDRRLGTAQALVTVQRGVGVVEQGPDPERQLAVPATDDGTATPATAEQVSQALGGAHLVPLRIDGIGVLTARGRGSAGVLETDLGDPLARGLVRLTAGRLPQTPDEVVVNAALAAEGYAVGDRLRVAQTGDGSTPSPRIVGLAESTTVRGTPFVAGPIGSLGAAGDDTQTWLAGGRPVSWAQVRALNAVGATVLSRQVVTHPPPVGQIPADVVSQSNDTQRLQVLALIAVMVLIEVVLLSGPAFAVGARTQQRSLALMTAAGGTPAQARRVVVASALVLGGAASLLGVGLGIGVARAVQPLLQAHSDVWFGPFDIVWTQLVGVAGFGLVSAFLAAIVPAVVASRQDVVAVLAGRRGDRRASRRSPLLGLVLLALGVVGSVVGAGGNGPVLIAGAAIPAVLGMVLLIPVVLAGLGRISGRLPLVVRYAVRDAARHRTRTVPAVAAVAASVAGVVALSIGLASDQKQNRVEYVASLSAGTGIVTDSSGHADWTSLESAVRRYAPAAHVTALSGLPDGYDAAGTGDDVYVDSFVRAPGGAAPIRPSGNALGASVLVSPDGLPAALAGLTAAQRRTADGALAAGTTVVFVPVDDETGVPAGASHGRLVRVTTNDQGTQRARQAADLATTYVHVTSDFRGPLAVLPPAAATALGVRRQTVSLALSGPTLSRTQQDDVDQATAAVSDASVVYVERGYQADQATVIVQWILIGLGAVLMLGGTLTATLLALSDARPDLATLSAVGASPRTRRVVGAAYAVVIGLVGAALGTAVGLIPGIAVTVPLTGPADGGSGQGPFLAIPWLSLLVLVVVLPFLAALVVGVATRSRLPLVARLD